MDNKKKPINITLNLILFVYLIFSAIISSFFDKEAAEGVPWDNVFDANPFFGVIGAILLVVVLVVSGAYLIQNFWNRFLSDVFKIREIIYQEALSIILIISLFTI